MNKDNSLRLNAIELDPNKVYHITVEVGDIPKEEVKEYMNKIKDLFSNYGIKAIYSASNQGYHILTVTELPMTIEE